MRLNNNKKCFLFWNCCGGIKSKLDTLKLIISKYTPEALFISEAEIRKTDDLGWFRVAGYDFHVTESFNHGTARSACYIKINSGLQQVKFNDHGQEILAFENATERLCGVYRPFKIPSGSTPASEFTKLMGCLELLSSTNKTLVVGGDFNVNLLKSSPEKVLLAEWAVIFSFKQ